MLKKFMLMFIVIFVFTVGCGKKDINLPPNPSDTKPEYVKFLGEWRGGEQEFNFMKHFDIYENSLILNIKAIVDNVVYGNFKYTQGSSGDKEAMLEFSGELKTNRVEVAFKDKKWNYEGKFAMIFGKDSITANISRSSQEYIEWGLPNGNFKFARQIEVKVIEIDYRIRSDIQELATFFSILDYVDPKNVNSIPEGYIIESIGKNIQVEYLKDCKCGAKFEVNDKTIIFDETYLNNASEEYYKTKVKKHTSVNAINFKNGIYTVKRVEPALNYPKLLYLLENKFNPEIQYAFVDVVNRYGKRLFQDFYVLEYDLVNYKYYFKKRVRVTNPIDFVLFRSLLFSNEKATQKSNPK